MRLYWLSGTLSATKAAMTVADRDGDGIVKGQRIPAMIVADHDYHGPVRPGERLPRVGQQVRNSDTREAFIVPGGTFSVPVQAFTMRLAKIKLCRMFAAADVAPSFFRPALLNGYAHPGVAPSPSDGCVLIRDRDGWKKWNEYDRPRSYRDLVTGDPAETCDGRELAHRTARIARVLYATARQQGYADAARLWTPRKKMEASLRASKAYKGSPEERDAYEMGFRWRWVRLSKKR